MDMEMLVDMFTRMNNADQKEFAQKLAHRNEITAKEIAYEINIAVRDQTIQFMD